jgi:hypothetical protein
MEENKFENKRKQRLESSWAGENSLGKEQVAETSSVVFIVCQFPFNIS